MAADSDPQPLWNLLAGFLLRSRRSADIVRIDISNDSRASAAYTGRRKPTAADKTRNKDTT